MKSIHSELLSAIFAIIAVVSDTRERIITHPLSILATLTGLFVFLKAGLYASFLLDMMYILLDLYGWYYGYMGVSLGTYTVN